MTTATLSPKQLASIRDATAPANVWHGSVRSGKTLSSLIAYADAIQRQQGRHGRVVIIGRTMDTIYRNVIAGLIEVLGPEAVRYTRGANTAVVLGQEVDIIGASDARSEGRIRGMTIRLAYVDEASLLPGEQFWQALMDRQMTIPESRTFATTNPDNPTHWLKASVIDRAEALRFATWHFDLDDNPVLTDQDKADAAARNTGLFYQRNILGLWVLADGVIWDMWDERSHLFTDPPAIVEYTLAIDYGTAGTFAALLLGRGADDCVYVCAEWRWQVKGSDTARRQLTDVEYSQRLRSWLDDLDPATNAIDSPWPGARTPSFVHVDPSASSFITQLHRDGWTGVRGADNSVADGIRSVASLLSAGRLKVHESCAGLRQEIPGYVWDERAALVGEDKPVKANDHSCDALRYGIMGTRLWWRYWLVQPAMS